MIENENANDDYISECKRNINPLIRILRWLNPLTVRCPRCGVGQISYAFDDWTGRIWISVYRCDCCHKEFI